jgi:hypothetical protein
MEQEPDEVRHLGSSSPTLEVELVEDEIEIGVGFR